MAAVKAVTVVRRGANTEVLTAIEAVPQRRRAEHHLGMRRKIGIHGDGLAVDAERGCRLEPVPGMGFGRTWAALPQKHDVGDDPSALILERFLGQADGADEGGGLGCWGRGFGALPITPSRLSSGRSLSRKFSMRMSWPGAGRGRCGRKGDRVRCR